MSDLDDPNKFRCIGTFTMPWAESWGDTRPGHKNPDKRERIRKAAIGKLATPAKVVKSWGFRIVLQKTGRRAYDIENAAKLILDAFSKRTLIADKSIHPELGLYDDDTIDFIRFIEITGQRVKTQDQTVVSVYAGVL